MHERFLNEIEDPEVWRLKRQATVHLFELVERNRCRHQAIVAHFDEELEPCGESCDHCSGVTVEELVEEARRGRRRGAARGQAAARQDGVGGSRPTDRDNAAELTTILLPEYGGAAAGRGRGVAPDFSKAPDPLFEELRAVRKRLADEAGVPAYIVFNDRTLLELAERRPADEEEMLEVTGVGPVKLERYGAAFLEAIRDFGG
jgi:ATP-dependent DNA helicase RecQ